MCFVSVGLSLELDFSLSASVLATWSMPLLCGHSFASVRFDIVGDGVLISATGDKSGTTAEWASSCERPFGGVLLGDSVRCGLVRWLPLCELRDAERSCSVRAASSGGDRIGICVLNPSALSPSRFGIAVAVAAVVVEVGAAERSRGLEGVDPLTMIGSSGSRFGIDAVSGATALFAAEGLRTCPRGLGDREFRLSRGGIRSLVSRLCRGCGGLLNVGTCGTGIWFAFAYCGAS